MLWLQKFCNLKVCDKSTGGHSDASDKEHTVMALWNRTNIIYAVWYFAILATFIWQGAFSKPDLHFCCILWKKKKPSTNNKQCNLGSDIMQHQMESNSELKNLCSYILGNAPAKQFNKTGSVSIIHPINAWYYTQNK